MTMTPTAHPDLRTEIDPLHELALLARSGDQEALEHLLTHPAIRRIILTIADQQVGLDEAEDIYQEVRLCISLKLHTWQATGTLTNWIGRITVHCCYDIQQRKKQEREIYQELRSIAKMRIEHKPPQIKTVLAEEKKTLIEQALDEMGEPCRRMLWFYIFRCLDKPEIMQFLGFKKTKFYSIWKHCYDELIQKIQNFF